jgi:hypothetical protein
MAGRVTLGINGSLPAAPGDTPVYTATIVDEYGAPVAAADLDTLTLSIVDTATKAVVNSASSVDILNTGRGTVDDAGLLTVRLLAADTALAAGVSEAMRSLVFGWTYNGGASAGHFEVDFKIKALSA